MKQFVKIVVCVCLVILSNYMPAIEDTNTKLKAVYVYSFSKNIDWPSAAKQGNFVIGIIGNSPLFGKLDEMSKTKKKDNQTIEVKTFANTSAVSNCHILFVPSSVENIKEVVTKVKNNSTLIVTEKAGLARQGAAINFVIKDNALKYELNKATAEKYDLKVGASLQTTAIVIE